MSVCDKYQPRKCWKTGHVEDTVTCHGDCSLCTQTSERLIPTFAELENAYLTYLENAPDTVRPNTGSQCLHALHSLYRNSDLKPTDRLTALTNDIWEQYRISAKKTLSPVSIKGIGERIHALLSKNARKFFKATLGWSIPPFPELQEGARSETWISLSREQRRKIRDWQFSLFDLSDPRKYLCVTAAWERGQRKCDVLRNHWSMFVETDGTIWWPYTSVKNGKYSNWPVDPDTWRMLAVARRRLRGLKVRHLGTFDDSYLRVREFSRNELATSAVWDACSDDLRMLMGWKGPKSMHNLRKDACDTVFQNLGVDEAEEFSTDCAKTLKKHYIAKKRILPNIPSVAKM